MAEKVMPKPQVKESEAPVAVVTRVSRRTIQDSNIFGGKTAVTIKKRTTRQSRL